MDEKTKSAVRAWFILQREVKRMQDEEREIRKEIIESIFGDPERIGKGTYTADIDENTKIKFTQTVTWKVNKENYEKKKIMLDARGLIGDKGAIKLEPKVSVSGMKNLSDEEMKLFYDVFEETYASPQLKIESSKE